MYMPPKAPLVIANFAFAICLQVILAEIAGAVRLPPLLTNNSGIKTLQFNRDSSQISERLSIEVLSDQVIHFELGHAGRPGTSNGQAIYLTPYVDRENLRKRFQGPTEFRQTGTSFETSALLVEVDPATLCVNIHDKVKALRLTRICPVDLKSDLKTLSLTRERMTDVYGLGEEFLPGRVGKADGNWINEVRRPGEVHGNFMQPFHGGFVGNAQFPVFYAVGSAKQNYAFFLDQVYKQNWDFRGDVWNLESWGEQIRFFFINGRDLPDLRTTYMSLVGRPLVPPKKAFGLWVSEYGFDSWLELREKLRSLRANHFPVDGFVLDLQWFGGINQTEMSPMGTLRFDEKKFANPKAMIQELREREGLGLMTIEESYVSRGLFEHQELEAKGLLARERADANKAFLINNEMPWWGIGGMIDWSNPEAGRLWHDWKRQPLIELGIMGHWTDLGEPEMYWDKSRPGAVPYYYGFPELGKNREADVHNVYSFLWNESIVKGYARHGIKQRPWILSRSGGPGIQRFGTAMWSGDIGSNLGSLATHLNAQMHMSLSGVDYFGSDIGGFYRGAINKDPGTDLNEMYTQWFANGAAFDVPVRPHTENVQNTRETAPDRIGDLKSNLANIRLRYELSLYYYSLAHRAYLYGEPVIPPLVYYYQDAPSDRSDFNVRTLGHEKLIGRDLLFAVVAKPGERQRDIYLPPGEWIDYRTNRRYPSSGTSIRNYPEYIDGVFRLPVFARAGAIIPKIFVDEKTMNIEGLRTDGSVRNELIARVFTGKDGAKYEFTLFEDDGRTSEYQSGQVATTVLEQNKDHRRVVVRIGRARGSYKGAPSSRQNVIELVAPADEVRPNQITVRLNGTSLMRHLSRRSLEAATSGWFLEPDGNVIIAKTDALSVYENKDFEFLF